MKSLIVVYSYHYNNTQKVAQSMAKVLDAPVKSPKNIALEYLSQYDLLGFGAGIDSGKHYKELLDFADALPQVTDKKAFIFSTAGVIGEKKWLKTTQNLRKKLKQKVTRYLMNFNVKGITQIFSSNFLGE